MSLLDFTRRGFSMAAMLATLRGGSAYATVLSVKRLKITDYGAIDDDRVINTSAIQSLINHLADQGGGTVVVPRGVFVSGALFLRPKVNLHLDKGAVLKCSTDMMNFQPQRTRIEGHFEEHFNPALLNANGCDGLRITGEGTLDGNGHPIWDMFWKLRKEAPDPKNFPNLSVPRARLALIENSRDVMIEGITFKDSQFWNLHLYKCQGVHVRKVSFEVPDDYKQAPSTDAIDLDSCQDVVIDGCVFSVTDDCVVAKGSKGPKAMQDKSSPPVERIRVRNCVFKRGHAMMTCGSEATIVRDIIVEDCTVLGGMNVLMLKLRPDTPQLYENIMLRNITLDADGGAILAVQPWSQYVNLEGEAPPKSIVQNVQLIGIKGRFGAFGTIKPNPGQTTISDIRLKDLDVQLKQNKLEISGVNNLQSENVTVNGKPVSL